MAGEVASLFVKLGLDTKEFQAGIGQAKKTTDGFAQGASRTGALVKGGFIAAGAGLAFMTGEAVKAERAQGEFMAATGASREEAVAFVSSMNGLAGTAGAVGKSFETIAATGTMVQQQFQTTGEQTATLTGQILDFSKVTKQDAAGAAADLEDTLSAYGKTADDAAGFMDQLVASSQKYGTQVGPDQLAVLRNMAPALQAMGQDLDDGIGLLNVFEVAGLDASAAARGLNSAITKLPEGQSLDDVIKRFSDLKEQGIDPTTEAVKIFGNKAGAALALAIQPGMDSLDDLGVSAEDAAGKSAQAADNMLTLTDRIRGFADKAVAGVRELGQGFGPALTGAASAATLAAPLLGTLRRAFGSAFEGLRPRLGGMLTNALAGARLKTGAWATRLFAPLTTAASSALSGLGAALAKNTAITNGLDAAGKAMGGRLGTAMKLGAAAGLAGLALMMAQEIGPIWDDIRRHQDEIAGRTSEATGKSTEEIIAAVARLRALPDAMDPVQRAIFETSAALPFALGDAKNTWGRSITELEAELTRRGIDITQITADMGTDAAAALAAGAPQVEAAGTDVGQAAVQGVATGAEMGELTDSWQRMGNETIVALNEQATRVNAAAREAGGEAGTALADGLRTSLPDAHQQWKDYVQGMKNALDPAKEMAWLEAKLASKKLQAGLQSENPFVRAQAVQMRDALTGQLDSLKTLMGQAGTQGGQALARQVGAQADEAADAAQRIRAAIMRVLSGTIKANVRIGIATGVANKLRNIPGFAAGGVAPRSHLAVVGEDGPELIMPKQDTQVVPLASPRLRGGGGGLPGGGDVIHLHVGTLIANDHGIDELIARIERRRRRRARGANRLVGAY